MLIYIGSKFCDDLIINIISSYWSELEIPCGEHIGPKHDMVLKVGFHSIFHVGILVTIPDISGIIKTEQSY